MAACMHYSMLSTVVIKFEVNHTRHHKGKRKKLIILQKERCKYKDKYRVVARDKHSEPKNEKLRWQFAAHLNGTEFILFFIEPLQRSLLQSISTQERSNSQQETNK